MRRMLAIAAMFVVAVPSLSTAEDHDKGHKDHDRDHRHGPVVYAPHVPIIGGPVYHGPVHVGAPVVHGPVHGPVGPVPVVVHPPWVYNGHSYAWHAVPYPHPWAYPPGYAYRLWGLGEILPPVFWSTPTYYYTDWALMGLPPPEPGFQYIQYGPDLLLVNVSTGAVVQVFPGAFS